MLREKIRGEALYCDDIRPENCLYGKTLRSGIAHGKIKEIKYPSMPEGYFVIDYRDIRGNNIVKIVELDQPVLAETIVNCIGEPISLIVGKDKKVLEKLVKGTDIQYEELEPLLHLDENSVFQDIATERGDMELARKEARYVFEKTMETGSQEHIYMEPQSMIAAFDGREITVTGSVQSLYAVKNAVEYCTGFPARVIAAEIGGGFGGKEDFPSLLACHAALCAIKAEGTVKIIYERDEDIICTTKRHPTQSHYKLYLDENYKLLGVEADLRMEAGAYVGLSNIVMEVYLSRACGVYNVPNVKIRARTFRTNKISFGAWRGFGAPQGIFAIETALDLFAREKNLDPVHIKKINFAQKGDLSTTGGPYREEVKLPQMLEELLEKSDYYNKLESYRKNPGKNLRGIGVSFSLLGGGLGGVVEKDFQKGKIRLVRTPEGDYEIFSTVLEIGQGPSITLPNIVAQVLNISSERVKLCTPDSKFCPDSGPTVASRSALIVGKLVERAALKIKKLLEKEENYGKVLEIEEEYRHPEGFQWDSQKHRGDYNINSSVAVNIVEVEIDSETFRIYPKRYWGYYDIGTPLDKKVVMGQIQGGVLQGIAHSHMERLEFDGKGGIVQKNLTDYLIPTGRDMLEMEIYLADNPGEQGPLGAKALGELPFIGMTSALLAGVNSALSTKISKIPLYPEILLEVKDEFKI